MEEKFTGYFEAGELETELWRQLKKRGWTITTVESCTGGAVAARIVNVAGASDILRQAYVTGWPASVGKPWKNIRPSAARQPARWLWEAPKLQKQMWRYPSRAWPVRGAVQRISRWGWSI